MDYPLKKIFGKHLIELGVVYIVRIFDKMDEPRVAGPKMEQKQERMRSNRMRKGHNSKSLAAVGTSVVVVMGVDLVSNPHSAKFYVILVQLYKLANIKLMHRIA